MSINRKKEMRLDHLFYMTFFILSLIIFNKLLLPGYILTLDMVWPEHFKMGKLYGWNDWLWNGKVEKNISRLPFDIFLYLANLLIPSWMIQKMLLISVFFFSGVGAYRLCPAKNRAGKFLAGLLYMINPFIYLRFLVGQLLLMLGYALLPFILKSVLEFFEPKHESRNDILRIMSLAMLLTLMTIFIVHYLIVVFGVLLLLLLVKLNSSECVRRFLILVVLYTLINLYWIIPFLMVEEKFHPYKFTEEDVKFFSTKQGIDFNVIFNTAAMYGFWRSPGYILPKNIIPFWYVFFFFILYLVVHGIITMKEKHSKVLIMVALVSLFLSTGITHQQLSKIFLFFYNKFPLFRGFREPQKLVGTLILVYSYFMGIGVSDILEDIGSKKTRILFIVLCVFVISVYTFPMLYNGLYGQLNSIFYPEFYEKVDEFFKTDGSDFNILYLPWHGYMDYSWSIRRLPAVGLAVFSRPVIQGADPMSHTTNPTYRYITYLLNQKNITNFGKLVSIVNVKYVVIDKTSLAPKKPYNFLYDQSDLEVIIDSDLVVFKNKCSPAKIYETDYVFNGNWDELTVNLKTENLDMKPLNYTKRSPIEFFVNDEPTKKYIVFTSSYSKYWHYDNQESVEYAGLVNLFNTNTSRKIHYVGFNYYLIGYIISGTVVVLLLLNLFCSSISKFLTQPHEK